MKLNKLSNRLNSYDIICVDFFDTIVHRVIPPEDVKKQWALEVAKKLNIVGIDLYKLRFNIEASLCHKSHVSHNELEFKYIDMCTALYEQINTQTQLPLDKFIELLKTVELNIEKRVLYVSYNFVNQLKQQRLMGKKIILISDFYFALDMMQQIFSHFNLNDLFHDVFISNECMGSKRSGNLYKQLKTKYPEINYHNTVMVGDNKHSDVNNATLHEIATIFKDASIQHTYYKLYEKQISVADTFNYLDQSYLKEMPVIYPQVVEALYLFIRKLHDDIIKKSLSQVVFLAREGQLLKTMFDFYTQYVGTKIQTSYLLVSRRSTFLPSLKMIDEERFENLFRQYINISILELLKNLNFEEQQIEEIRDSMECDISQRVDNLPESFEFQQLKANKIFRKLYEQNRIGQLEGIMAYFKQEGLLSNQFTLVDIGWKGTIQDNIHNLIPDVKLLGYYLGLNSQGAADAMNQKTGVLFNEHTGFNIYSTNSWYNECRSIFEVLLSADHGSAGYYTTNGECVLLDNKLEESLFTKVIQPEQSVMLEYFKVLVKTLYYKNISLNECEKNITKRYGEFIFKPHKKQIKFFSKCFHIESFGVHESTMFIASSKMNNMLQFLKSPKHYIQSSIWPGYALQLHNMSVVGYIYQFLRKLVAK